MSDTQDSPVQPSPPPAAAPAQMPVPSAPAQGGNDTGWFFWFSLLLLCASVSAASIFFYDRFVAQKLVYYDVSALESSLDEAIKRREISSEAAMQKVDILKLAIESLPPNVVVVRSEALLRKSNVKTAPIQR